MSEYTILDKILYHKKKWITDQNQRYPLHYLKNIVQSSQRNFYKTLSDNKNQAIFILEHKIASPSKGIICKNFNPIQIAQIYKNYATVISVLTDEKYFHGNFNILRQISNTVTQPVLCKDFFISEWQVYFARIHQADAILLMLSILNNATYLKLSKIAHTLNMGVITEIMNEDELKRAISLNAKIIGINNRNLHDLSIDINRTINLSKNIPPNTAIIISESGINNHCQIKVLRNYVHGFLIGTALMSQMQLDVAMKKLILGENKICGITQTQDAYIAYKLGAVYGGLIFVNTSPRYINITNAKKIVSYIKYLKYVGVFCNATINDIVNIVNTLNLSAIQLHGTENITYIHTLKTQLPTTCHIWKSINMQKPLPTFNLPYVDRYLLDNENGGTGKTFNWSLLSKIKLSKIILAGGLTIENCKQAMHLGCAGLDFNSGIEIIPGIKNHYKIAKIFKILRTY